MMSLPEPPAGAGVFDNAGWYTLLQKIMCNFLEECTPLAVNIKSSEATLVYTLRSGTGAKYV